MKKCIFPILFLLLVHLSLFSQYNNIKFEHFSVVDGLPENSVRCIFQDHLGLLWFGTQNGLVKYDGYNFQTYIPNKKNKLGRIINSISEDSKGNLWVCTSSGRIYNFLRDIEKLKHLEYDSTIIPKNYPYHILVDDNDDIMIGTSEGLILYEVEKNIFSLIQDEEKVQIKTNDKLILEDKPKEVTYIYKFKKDSFLLGTNNGLLFFDKQSNTTRPTEYPALLNRSKVTNIIEDRNKNLWVSTYGSGLYKIEHESNKVTSYNRGARYLMAFNKEIIEDRNGMIWVADYNSGVFIIDPRTENIYSNIANPDIKGGLSGDRIRSVFQDKSGAIWIGTDSDGLNKTNINSIKFNSIYFQNQPLGEIGVIFNDSEGKIWVSTMESGLKCFNQMGELLESYEWIRDDMTTISSEYVSAITEDNDNNIWVGTPYFGLCRINKKSNKIKRFLFERRVGIKSLLTDSEGTIWVGTSDRGVFTIKHEDVSKADIFSNESLTEKLENDNVGFYKVRNPNCIYEDSKGLMWFATDGDGLFKFDENTEKLTRYFDYATGFDIITSIFEDSKGRFWCGTYYGGLFEINRETDERKSFLKKDGLPLCAVYSILEDNKGNFWLGTDRGLAKYNHENEDLKIFGGSDGIQEGSFVSNSACILDNGKMLFGGRQGLNSFYPNQITKDTIPPDVIFTSFKVLNKELEIGGYSPLKKHITRTKEIQLAYWQNDIQIEFSALSYNSPEKNQYGYYIENKANPWKEEIGAKRELYFTNMNPGEYFLHVVASNSDGIWNEEGARLRIVINPPPWKTWWAYSIYVILSISLIIFIRRYDRNRVKLKYDLKLQESETQKHIELGEIKSKFLANISHEFRTPLTLIISPLQSLINKTKDIDIRTSFEMIQRNAQKLLFLINQLLEISKIDAEKIKLQLIKGDIISNLSPILNSFSSLADSQNKTYSISWNIKSLQGYYDSDKLERIITNLVSNAFKYTDEGDSISVDVSLNDSNDRIKISVVDTGKGISEEDKKRIFERFYIGTKNETGNAISSGLGMTIVKELVELYDGEIYVDSSLGEGSTFTFEMPYLLESFKPNQLELNPSSVDSNGMILLESDSYKYRTQTQTDKVKTEIKKYEILVVEDNDELRSFIVNSLNQNYSITEAVDGKEGIDIALKSLPDLIISDLMMPEIDGMELCEKLKTDERTSHIPIIILTAKDSDESKLESYEIGADEYIVKPFNLELLRARIQNLLNQRKLLHEKYKNITPAARNLKVTSFDDRFMVKLYNIIESNLLDPDFNVEDLSSEIGLSRSQLYRKIKSLTGISISDLIRIYRLEKAAELLVQNFGSISEICFKVGFKEQSNFTTAFKKHFGIPPTHYKESKK